MATVMKMFWPGLTAKHYEDVRRDTNFEGNKPAGGKYHVAWLTSEGLHVIDVWESGKAFDAFVQSRLMPSAKKLGIPGEPKVELFEAHNTFAPNP
jgi:hypothetical protein